ncbi:FKBP-type peptidyl-prolyl cis-trans isomerase [Microbacterium excoecariae]|uniref:FKBP-type peptidyl-prolyl cis-trans isomerase n=1 Tax=Microbacterium excoecariae TaxID=2715210 RepID=UPI00140E4353|nr:hypothetical protein [Microbacterium excoecariae]NHI16796.1 hypothetical protein [Microbacterium excoecariae]
MRKTTAVATLIGLMTLALAGCSSAPETPEACGRDAATNEALLSAVDVQGALGQSPTVDFPLPFVAIEADHLDLVTGDGPVIESTAQGVVFDATLYDGATGTPIPMTAYSGDETQVLGLTNVVAQLPGMEDAFLCASEGSRVVAALGEDGISESFASQIVQFGAQYGLDIDTSSMVAVIDIARVLPASADGSPVYNEGHGLPSVVRTPDGVPGIIIPDGDAPTEQAALTLLQGDGPELSGDEAVTLQYTSVSWGTRTVTTSTWESGAPATATLDQLPEGFADALAGATVGSQVMVVVPDGDGGATVSVIDVLGAVDQP